MTVLMPLNEDFCTVVRWSHYMYFSSEHCSFLEQQQRRHEQSRQARRRKKEDSSISVFITALIYVLMATSLCAQSVTLSA